MIAERLPQIFRTKSIPFSNAMGVGCSAARPRRRPRRAGILGAVLDQPRRRPRPREEITPRRRRDFSHASPKITLPRTRTRRPAAGYCFLPGKIVRRSLSRRSWSPTHVGRCCYWTTARNCLAGPLGGRLAGHDGLWRGAEEFSYRRWTGHRHPAKTVFPREHPAPLGPGAAAQHPEAPETPRRRRRAVSPSARTPGPLRRHTR